MAFFNKKKDEKSKVDQLLELMNGLTDEELEEFLNKADLDGDGDVDEEDAEKSTGDQIDKAIEDAEEKGEEPSKAEIDESVGEQEALEDDKDSQDAKDRVDESIGEEEHLEKEDAPDHYAELKAEIDNLKEAIAGLTSRLEADKDNEDDKVEFGLDPQNTGKEADGKSDLDKAREKYWAF